MILETKKGVNVLYNDGHVEFVKGDCDVRNATQGDIFWPDLDDGKYGE